MIKKFQRSVRHHETTDTPLTNDQDLKKPLREYLTNLPASERKHVTEEKKKKNNHKPSKPKVVDVVKVVKSPLSGFEQEALKYLRARQDKRGDTRINDSRMLQMVNALASVRDWELSEEEFWKFLEGKDKGQVASTTRDNNDSICSVSASNPGGQEPPLQRLLSLYRNVELSTKSHILAVRILKVLIHHQYKLVGASGIDNDARRRQMLERTGYTVERTKDLRSRATGWLRFISVFGVGALAMTHAQADHE
jgi:Ca2+-binding EF-hand superfamily protein